MIIIIIIQYLYSALKSCTLLCGIFGIFHSRWPIAHYCAVLHFGCVHSACLSIYFLLIQIFTIGLMYADGLL